MTPHHGRRRTPSGRAAQLGSMQQGLALPWGISCGMFGYAIVGAWIGWPITAAIVCGLAGLAFGQLLTYEDWGFLLSYCSIIPPITHFFVEPEWQRWILSAVTATLALGVTVLAFRGFRANRRARIREDQKRTPD